MSEEDLKARASQQSLLVEVNATLAALNDAETLLNEILSRLIDRAGLMCAAVYTLASEESVLRCLAEQGDPGSVSGRTLPREGPSLVAGVARQAEPIYVADTLAERRYSCGQLPVRSEYAVPLVRGGKVLGVLSVASREPDGIRAVTRKLVEQLAVQCALTLERAELFNELNATGEQFRSLLDQDYFGVALCAEEGQIFSVNPAFARLLGYKPQEMQGKLYADFVHPEERVQSLEVLTSFFRGDRNHLVHARRFVHQFGNSVWCTVVFSLIRPARGRPAHVLVIVADISDKKQAEEERARLLQQLGQAQKLEAVGTLASGLAHDFNNFLGVILGFASLVRLRLRPKDPLWEAVLMIEHSAECAADLTRQLLGLVQQDTHSLGPVNIAEVLDRLEKIVKRTFDRRIRVEKRVKGNMPTVEGNANQLEHAIFNLCVNARDAMPDGGTLTLDASVVGLGPQDPLRPPQFPAGDYLRVAVKDTGTGMNPDVTKRIFEPFFTVKAPGRGTGLGLVMVNRTVSAHKGFLRVESEVVRGSEVSIYLPTSRRPEQTLAQIQPVRVHYGSGTVLVIDDEPMVLAFAQRGLERLGYRVLTAENAKRALEIYATRAREIGCVLLDLIMPEISGFEIYEKMREINPEVRVILSSGYSADKVARDARKIGAADFVGKPYTLETLSEALRKAFQNQGTFPRRASPSL